MARTWLGALAVGLGVGWALTAEHRGSAAFRGPKRPRTRALELGARVLQDFTPVRQIDTYLVGFHPMKDAPEHQMEAHHYCALLDDDRMQCVIYDGNGRDARLIGVEYIISERLFAELPPRERASWHPHNYEILSGQLIAPGIPEPIERRFLALKMNSYGKTWHTWMPGADGELSSRVPLGAPTLAWSFNRDGEVDAGLLADRDRRLGVDTERRREARAPLCPLAHPQRGVAVLEHAFPGAHGAPDGVSDAAEQRR